MTDWTDAERANGPAVAAWLRDRDRLPAEMHDPRDEVRSLWRAVRRWEGGENPTFAALDRWLTFIGRHVSELPSEVWVEDDRRAPALALLAAGEPLKPTAARLGLAPETLRKWRNEALAPSQASTSEAPSCGKGGAKSSAGVAA